MNDLEYYPLLFLVNFTNWMKGKENKTMRGELHVIYWMFVIHLNADIDDDDQFRLDVRTSRVLVYILSKCSLRKRVLLSVVVSVSSHRNEVGWCSTIKSLEVISSLEIFQFVFGRQRENIVNY